MHIKNYCIDFTKSKKLGKMVIEILKKNNIKLICLAGFMKILPEYFIKLYNGKIINIHPSLLPRYKGLNTHKRVIFNIQNQQIQKVNKVVVLEEGGHSNLISFYNWKFTFVYISTDLITTN